MKNEINLILFAVGKEPEVQLVSGSGWSGIKTLLGDPGMTIELAPRWLRDGLPPRVTLYFDEDGRSKRLPVNRAIQLARTQEPLRGPFVAIAVEGGVDVSMTEAEVEQVLLWANERTKLL